MACVTASAAVSEHAHEAVVDGWIERGKSVPLRPFIDAFASALEALWNRALVTLGDVTLTAIVDRVVYTANEEFPTLCLLEVDLTGFRCDALRARAHELTREQVTPWARFVLLQFLTVLGNLTAEILTPALHATLAAMDPAAPRRVDTREPGGGPLDAGTPEETKP